MAAYWAATLMTSLAAVLGDSTLKDTIKRLCDTTEGLEAWITGSSRAYDDSEDSTEQEMRESYNSLDSQFLDANCRIMELHREVA